MPKSNWFYDRDGHVSGPVNVAELRQLAASGRLLPTDQVRKGDMERWVKAGAVKGLFIETAAEPATSESPDRATVFDFFGAGPPPAEAEPEREPFNPVFDFLGTAAYGTRLSPAEAPPPARKTPRSRRSRSMPVVAADEPPPNESGLFSFTAPAAAVDETPVAFTADVPMATPVFEQEVPFAMPVTAGGTTPPLVDMTGPQVALQPDGTAIPTGGSVALSVNGGWLTARDGSQEMHLRLSRLDAVTLQDRTGAGLVLSVHAGGQSVAVHCDDAETALTFSRRLLAAAG